MSGFLMKDITKTTNGYTFSVANHQELYEKSYENLLKSSKKILDMLVNKMNIRGYDEMYISQSSGRENNDEKKEKHTKTFILCSTHCKKILDEIESYLIKHCHAQQYCLYQNNVAKVGEQVDQINPVRYIRVCFKKNKATKISQSSQKAD